MTFSAAFPVDLVDVDGNSVVATCTHVLFDEKVESKNELIDHWKKMYSYY